MSWLAEKFRRVFKLDDREGIAAAFGTTNDAGISLGNRSVLQLSAANACIQLLCDTISALPLVLYEKQDNGGRRAAKEHPVYNLLKYSPNYRQTPSEYKESIVAHLNIWGNFYCHVDSLRNVPKALNVLHPADVVVVTDESQDIKEYRYNRNGKAIVYQPEEILHIRAFCVDGVKGITPIAYGANTFGSSIAADKSAAKLFANGMKPSGVLTMDQFLKPEQRQQAHENIIRPMEGVGNTGKTLILEGGMKYTHLTLSPEDAQLLETRKFNIEEICRWYGVPPVLVGHAMEGQTMWGRGIEELILTWLKTKLGAKLVRIEESLERRLLTNVEREKYSIRFNLDALMRADSNARAELFTKFVQNGIMTRNEVRELENLPSDKRLDSYTVQQQIIPIDMMGKHIKGNNNANT